MSPQQVRRKRGRPSNAELALRRQAAAERPNNPLVNHEQIIRKAAEVLGIPMEPESIEPEPPSVPPSWTKGQLLNVRNAGECYVITLLGEEFDPRHPERALKFTNPALCQNFVSSWYARENHDPRAR